MSSDIIHSNLGMARPSAYETTPGQKRRAGLRMTEAAIRAGAVADLADVLGAIGVTR